MPKFKYALTNGKTLTLEGSEQPSDEEVEQHAKAAGVELKPAKTIAERNAEARVNMSKQPTEAELQARAKSEQWTPSAMLERAKAGAKGEAEGFVGGLAAPVLMLGHALRHPLEAADEAGQLALGAGAAAYHVATQPPGETIDAAKHALVRFASDPENIGAAAGSVDSMIAAPAIVRAAKSTRVGKAVAAGVSDAANRIPGVKAARAVLKPEPPPAPKTPKPTVAQTKAAEEAARLSQNGVVPVADATASNPNIEGVNYMRRQSIGNVTVPRELADPHAAVSGLVTSTADSAASNPTASRVVLRTGYPTEAPLSGDAAVRARVVPTADAAASSGVAAPETVRTPYTLSPDQPTPASRVTSLADLGASNPDIAAPAGRVGYTPTPEPRVPLDPHADSLGRVVPLADDSARSLHTMDAPARPNNAYNGLGDFSIFEDPTIGPPLADASKFTPDELAELNAFLGKNEPVSMSDFTLVDNGGQPIANASGESAASAEALSRQSGMQSRGEQFVVRKGGVERPLIGPEAVDYNPQPGETYGVKAADGSFRTLSVGTKSGRMTAEEAALIGNRGKGSLPLAERQRLLREMMNRSKK